VAASETGRIVFAVTQKGVVAGVVVDRAAGRTAVIVPGGGRETWTDDRIVWLSEVRAPMHSARAAAEAAAAFDDRVREVVPSVDLASLWEVLADDPEARPVPELAGLLFPSAGTEHRAAVACALAVDDTYFKPDGEGAFAPVGREALAAALTRKRSEVQENDLLERTAAALSGLMDERKTLVAADQTARSGASWLRAVAVFGDVDKDGRRGAALTERLLGGPVSDPATQAFHLLVRLGVFDEDEVLAIHRNRIRLDFPAAVEEEAARIAATPLADDESRGRPELRWPEGACGPIAIDDPWTTDVDDALMVEPDGDTVRVHVLIADPSSKVALGSAVAEEGIARAATLYLPTGKVPMFPRVLSEEALSLTAGPVRPMLDFACDLGPDGSVAAFQVNPVFATLARRVTYGEADEAIAAGAPGDPLASALRSLSGLAWKLRQKRVEAGAVLVERDEVSVRVEEGEVLVRRLPWDSPARRLVGEFMVLACTLAGRFARENGIPVVYRRQNPPQASPDDRRNGPAPKAGTRAFAYRVLRSLRRAEPTTQPDFHWGLGVVGYTQVTSPLRRFQDFLAHVQIKGFIRAGRAPLDAEHLLRAFGDLEGRADALIQAEREAKRYYLLKALKRCLGQDVTGEVVDTRGSRAVVELDETGLDLPVPGAGHIAVGTPVRVRVHEVSPRRDRVVLALA